MSGLLPKTVAATGLALSLCWIALQAGCSPAEPGAAGPPTRPHADERPAAGTDTPTPAEQALSNQLKASTEGIKESIRYTVPEGWVPKQAGGLRKASFDIAAGDLVAEATATGLPSSATQLLLNVNLWRKQIGLEPTTQQDLDASLEITEVDGRSGPYIRLVGPAESQRPRSMLVALVGQQEQTWFFRLLGDADLVQREQSHFEEFLKSVQFVPAAGDNP